MHGRAIRRFEEIALSILNTSSDYHLSFDLLNRIVDFNIKKEYDAIAALIQQTMSRFESDIKKLSSSKLTTDEERSRLENKNTSIQYCPIDLEI